MWIGRVIEGLVRWRWLGLTLAVLLTLVAWPISLQLKFEQSIESLYARDNPRLLAFRRSKATFGGDEFLIVAYTDPELLTADGAVSDAARDRLEGLVKQLREVPGIDPASIQDLATSLRAPYGRQRIRQFLEGLLVGSDGVSTAVISRLVSVDHAPIPRSETFRKVREIAASQDIPGVVVGEPIQVHDMFRYVEEDGATLGRASSLLLMGVILILFRSLRWTLLPWLVVQATLIWTKAGLVLSGLELSMVSSMLDSLVTIIGISTCVHVALHYRVRRAQLDRTAATAAALRGLAVPVFWTIVTTASGFAALMSSHIAPVGSFGLMMTLGTLLVFAAAALILPGGALLGPRTATPAEAPGEARTTRMLIGLADAVLKRPWWVGGTMLILTLFCAAGLRDLVIETDFSKNFRANSPIVQALDFFESNLGGAGTWEVNFPAPAELTDEYLDQVRAFADDLRTLEARTTPDRLTKIVALTDGLDLIPRDILFARIPLSTRIGLLDRIQPEFAPGLYNAEARRMRIVLRAIERQPSADKLRLIRSVEQLARKHFPQSDAEATGLFVLLAFLIESLMDDQVTSALLAAALIFVQMTLAYRRVSLGISLLVPNIFPIVFVIGVMGWLGMKVNIATAMIASVSMGLTIDSSIHYLDGYRSARGTGMSFGNALRSTHASVGLALTLTNFALVTGFTVLTLSHFVPLIYFGILVSVAMIGGLIGNLVILPLFLRLVDRR